MKKYDTIADIEIDITKDQSSLQTLREFKVSRDVMPAASANALTSLICMWVYDLGWIVVGVLRRG
jgi:hypothetical protein